MEHNNEHILIVDDDPDLSQRLARYLEEQGYSVALAGDGEQMLAQMAVRKPDLLLLDLMLPGDDGLTLARRLRADQLVPMIAVPLVPSPEHERRARRLSERSVVTPHSPVL